MLIEAEMVSVFTVDALYEMTVSELKAVCRNITSHIGSQSNVELNNLNTSQKA